MQLKENRLLKNLAYLNGEWTAAREGSTFRVCNPYDGSLLAEVADLGEEETCRTIELARQAQVQWAGKSAGHRSRILRRWHDLILEHTDDLALILTSEQGKPLAEAVGEIRYGASFVEWYAEEAKRAYGDVIPAHGSDKRITILKQPVGVVAAITPWNFPVAMVTRKVAPALAVGCSVILKPADATPLSALALAVLAHEAGFPPGVFNVITTTWAKEVGKLFCTSPLVRKLSFTGSTAVGKELMRQCATTVKKLSLELGGNAPFIVFDDADLPAAVQGAIESKYRNGGQTCVCANRIYVQAGIYERFVAEFAAATQELKLGDGRLAETDLGPLINKAALEKVEQLVDDACAKGARALTGGHSSTLGGYFYAPTVLTDVNHTMDIHQAEIFGPVAPIFRFETEADAIRAANDTRAGLAAYFYGRDYARIWRVAEALEFGMVGINTGMISTAVAPFGGIKESGFGREGSFYGLDDYLEVKYLCWGGIEPTPAG
ncbi:NAD-dependent succinate-semialdehyde dehydrogenase [Neolewinella lacunae]|uniref:NAD-dependent succinate-semialdehyde dehydrogenase n=1 Tax=Neolewinella lacunae TaxID=1517758 RepID=A0A923T9Y5_9BACT|nr:NAD-dependent succinate-semialdehyde dehydrogenase [Neolewinella lacunae]MBC6996011.1 NAD-dependent succinate-semialdehyde dehydrogenase [Neolewinella lacunae]MDN3633185.1 NAD-dependent succinate-semialdehyde dehydrogenase [Neolewinella lacunae]